MTDGLADVKAAFRELILADILFSHEPWIRLGAFAGIFGVDPATARSHGILIVEIGVGITVMAVMVWIYYNLSSAGRQDEGL